MVNFSVRSLRPLPLSHSPGGEPVLSIPESLHVHEGRKERPDPRVEKVERKGTGRVPKTLQQLNVKVGVGIGSVF